MAVAVKLIDVPTPCGEDLSAVTEFRVRGPDEKVAVTVVAADRVTVQEPGREQPPLQPAKVEPVAGVAVSVTAVPLG